MLYLLIFIVFACIVGYLSYSYYQLNVSCRFYQSISNHKMWVLWQSENRPLYSKFLLEKLGIQLDLQTFIRRFFKEENLALESHLKSLHVKDFDVILRENGKLFNVIGRKIQNYRFIEIVDLEKVRSIESAYENKLAQLEEKIRRCYLMLDSIPLSIWMRGEQNEIIYCNQKYADFQGLNPNQVTTQQAELGSKFAEKSPYVQAKEVFRSKRAGELKDKFNLKGERKILDIKIIPTDFGTISYANDVTQFHKLETDIKKLGDSYMDIFEQLSTPIAFFNDQATLTFYNTAYLHIFDFQKEFLDQAPHIYEILDNLRGRQKIAEPGDFAAYKKNQRALFNSLMSPLEETLHLPNGKIVRNIIAPQPSGGLLFIYDDISHTLKLEQQNKTLNASQKELIDHLHEGIIIFGSDYRMLTINPIVSEIFGIERLFSIRHLDDFLAQIQENLTTGSIINTKQEWIEYFEKRTHGNGTIRLKNDAAIGWHYSPLPDGTHLLSLINMMQKVS